MDQNECIFTRWNIARFDRYVALMLMLSDMQMLAILHNIDELVTINNEKFINYEIFAKFVFNNL